MSVWAGQTHASFSLRCSWPEGSPPGGFDRGCLDSGFSELVSPQHDREAALSSFLRSHPCIQVSHLYLCTTLLNLPTLSNVLSMNSPSLFDTFMPVRLTHLYYPVKARPKLILYHPYITYATYIA